MKLRAIKKWEIKGLDDAWLVLSETKEGNQIVLSISRLDGSPIQTIRFGKEEWDALCDLRYEVRLTDDPISDD